MRDLELLMHLKGVNVKHGSADNLPANCANYHPTHSLWTKAQRTGRKIVKLIGYDSSPADIRRAKNLKTEDKDFLYYYPLQQIGWTRQDCIKAIEDEGLPTPIKSACWFCPASQKWEIFWLAANHPDLFMKALDIEHRAMLGKHSHWPKDECTYDKDWVEYVTRPHLTWPTTKITVGLGRSFAWNRFAVDNDIIDSDRQFIGNKDELNRKANQFKCSGGNAADLRTC